MWHGTVRREMPRGFWSENLQERDYAEDLDHDERIIEWEVVDWMNLTEDSEK